MSLPLYLISGLGCDERLFVRQRSMPLDVRFIRWLPPHGNEPTVEYAKRMGEGIDTSKPFLLGGVSFGGMMALQMTRFVAPRALILVSSCRTPGALPGWYGAPADLVTQWVAPALLKQVLCSPMMMLHPFGPMDEFTLGLLAEMTRDCTPELLCWSLRTVTALPPVPVDGVPVHQIHGRLDRIIPVRLEEPEEIIENAGHMINVTHADRVNRFIIERAARYE